MCSCCIWYSLGKNTLPRCKNKVHFDGQPQILFKGIWGMYKGTGSVWAALLHLTWGREWGSKDRFMRNFSQVWKKPSFQVIIFDGFVWSPLSFSKQTALRATCIPSIIFFFYNLVTAHVTYLCPKHGPVAIVQEGFNVIIRNNCCNAALQSLTVCGAIREKKVHFLMLKRGLALTIFF